MNVPVVEYVTGSSLDDLALWVRASGALLDLSSGYTYSLVVGDGTSGTGGFTTTTLFTGAVGAGVPPSGTPNVVKVWPTSGELAGLASGASYKCTLSIIRQSDSRTRKRQFFIRVLAT